MPRRSKKAHIVKEQHMASKKSGSNLHSAETVEITDSVAPQQFRFCPLNAEQQAVMCAALNNTGTGNQYEVHPEIQYHGVGTPLSEQFSTHRIIGDGNWYFRCLSYALTGNENAHNRDLRQRVVEFERQNRSSVEVHVWTGDTFEGHVSRVSMVGSYARDGHSRISCYAQCQYLCLPTTRKFMVMVQIQSRPVIGVR